MREYNVKLSEKHVDVMVRALDMYSRILIGQLKEILYTHIFGDFPKASDEDIKYAEELLFEIQQILFKIDYPNMHLGITSKDASDSARISWDMQQVLRHKVSWDRNPEGGMTVNFDTPLKTSPLPLVEITQISDEDKS